MRILVLADIHANWPALSAVDEQYDVCFFLGDLVDYNLEPTPCIDWVRKHAAHAVRGNHDHAAAQFIQTNGRSGYRYLTSVTRALTQELLSADDRRYLGRLPITRTVTLAETRFHLVHASPRDPLDEYNQPTAEFWESRLQYVNADVVCVGHTHHPYVLQVGAKLIVNPGSIGQPRDGDPRASYAVIEGNHIQLKRVEYPVEETVNTITQSALPEQAKTLLSEVLRSGTLPKPTNNSQNQKPAQEPLKENPAADS